MEYFQTYYLGSQEAPPQLKEFNNDKLTLEEEAAVLWIVLFTCVFQSLHKVPARAMDWLLKFLGVLIYFLGKFADPINGYHHIYQTLITSEQNIYKNKLYRQK